MARVADASSASVIAFAVPQTAFGAIDSLGRAVRAIIQTLLTIACAVVAPTVPSAVVGTVVGRNDSTHVNRAIVSNESLVTVACAVATHAMLTARARALLEMARSAIVPLVTVATAFSAHTMPAAS